MRCPRLPEDWLQVKSVFCRRWPGCHGWKAYSNQMSKGGGSFFHNYKGFHSIVLLALVDGDYKILWVVLGAAGSSSDAQIFKHTNLRHKVEDGSIGFPESECLGIGEPKLNFILRDDAFPLKVWLMKPCSRHGLDIKEMVFNYRISWGRRVVENAFGILTSRFRIFQSPMPHEPPVVIKLVMACLVMHNLLRIRYPG